MDGESPDPVAPQPVPQKKRGCFFYGCLTGVILMVVVLVGGLVVTKIILGRFNQFISLYTDTNSVPLPKTAISADEIKMVMDRVSAFSDALDRHSNAPTLILTGPEINAWLESRTNLSDYRGQFFVSLDDNQAKAQLSLSLDKIKFPGLHTEGRYLNGNGTFDVSVTDGILDVYIRSMTVKGKAVPPNFLASLQQQFSAGANRGANTNAISEIDSLTVTNSTVVIKGKSY